MIIADVMPTEMTEAGIKKALEEKKRIDAEIKKLMDEKD